MNHKINGIIVELGGVKYRYQGALLAKFEKALKYRESKEIERIQYHAFNIYEYPKKRIEVIGVDIPMGDFQQSDGRFGNKREYLVALFSNEMSLRGVWEQFKGFKFHGVDVHYDKGSDNPRVRLSFWKERKL